METLFGAEMPIAAKVLLALLIVLGLAGAVFYVVRYASPGRFVTSALRGRQPRLAVIEVAGVDQRRRLVLIRRDNVEHLLMIGGPSDVVVEPNILRAVAVGSSREAPQTRAEPPRAMAADGGMWPQQPEVAARRPAPPAHDDTSWLAPQSEPPARAAPDHRPDPRPDPLAGLAAELGRASAPPEPITPQRESVAPPRDSAPRDVKRPPPPAAATAQASASDQNLTEMAQRLEAALRQSPSRAPEPPPARPAPELPSVARLNGAQPPTNGPAGTEPPRAPVTELRAPPRAEAKPPAPPKAVYDNLEQEMASLLGRPAGKV
jgi:flagellar protein FliO/FliZ